MFTDHLIMIFGKTIAITSHDQLMIAVSVVTGLVYWVLLYFARKRMVQRSSGTGQLADELSRIANALEKIANRPVDRTIAAAMRSQQPPATAHGRESNRILYSMFGR